MQRIKAFFSPVLMLCAAGVGVLVISVTWAARSSQAGVEQAVHRNFTAAGLLARTQVEAERMRRFEKEMFIYAALPEKRKGYVKEFNEANGRLLTLLDTMLAPSGKAFDDAEREEIGRWKNAAVFYVNQFDSIARRADETPLASLNGEQRSALTLAYNDAITEGKNRFRDLLSGTGKLLAEKERRSHGIALDIDRQFKVLIAWLVGLGAAFVLLVGLLAMPRPVHQGGSRASSMSGYGSPRSSLLPKDGAKA